jgi:ElaB/YqjD/DUF883 family membrane-anchored ribosome-binding protein
MLNPIPRLNPSTVSARHPMTEETTQAPTEERPAAETHQETFRERFETLLPTIQREWPQVARQTLEATRGSFDEVAEVIASQTGRTATVVKHQLVELLDMAGTQTSRLADSLAPLEKQLEGLLDDLNATLRPRIEKPVRERPLMAIGIAAGVGVLLGMLLTSGRRSA